MHSNFVPGIGGLGVGCVGGDGVGGEGGDGVGGEGGDGVGGEGGDGVGGEGDVGVGGDGDGFVTVVIPGRGESGAGRGISMFGPASSCVIALINGNLDPQVPRKSSVSSDQTIPPANPMSLAYRALSMIL